MCGNLKWVLWLSARVCARLHTLKQHWQHERHERTHLISPQFNSCQLFLLICLLNFVHFLSDHNDNNPPNVGNLWFFFVAFNRFAKCVNRKIDSWLHAFWNATEVDMNRGKEGARQFSNGRNVLSHHWKNYYHCWPIRFNKRQRNPCIEKQKWRQWKRPNHGGKANEENGNENVGRQMVVYIGSFGIYYAINDYVLEKSCIYSIIFGQCFIYLCFVEVSSCFQVGEQEKKVYRLILPAGYSKCYFPSFFYDDFVEYCGENVIYLFGLNILPDISIWLAIIRTPLPLLSTSGCSHHKIYIPY